MEVFKTRNQKELKRKFRSMGLLKRSAAKMAHEIFEGFKDNSSPQIFELSVNNNFPIRFEVGYKRLGFQGELNFDTGY